MTENAPNVRQYTEINADSLIDQGIVDIIQTPVNGIDRHPDIPWNRVSSLAVQATYINTPEKLEPNPHYLLMVHFKKEKPDPVGFVLKQDEGETFSICTVSGAQAGLVPLDMKTSSIIAQLLMSSLQPENNAPPVL